MFDDAAVGQKGDLVGNGTGEVHRVGHEDESAAFGFEVGDDLQDLGGHFRVQRGGGFIEKEKSGMDGHRAGDGDTLSLSAGEFGRPLVGVTGEVEAFEKFERTIAGGFGSEAVHGGEGKHDIGQRVEVREQVPGLEDGADVAAEGAQRFFPGGDALSVDCQ